MWHSGGVGWSIKVETDSNLLNANAVRNAEEKSAHAVLAFYIRLSILSYFLRTGYISINCHFSSLYDRYGLRDFEGLEVAKHSLHVLGFMFIASEIGR